MSRLRHELPVFKAYLDAAAFALLSQVRNGGLWEIAATAQRRHHPCRSLMAKWGQTHFFAVTVPFSWLPSPDSNHD